MTKLSPESWNSIWAPPTSGGKRSPRQLPFFDFSCLKSRSSIILLSTSLILLGIFSPFLLLILEPEVEREMGLAWVGRVCYSSLLTMSSVLPRHSRQYTCQTAGLGSSLALLFLTTTHHWVWLFGLFSGAYAYALKVFVLQKVRARNFARAWSLVQMSQSVSVLTGVCISSYLSAGHLVSAVSVITGSLSLSLLNLHR